jgi:FMN phosphatase YigB (HAD superfamily)
VKANQVWMVGDDLARDIAGAQQLGIYSIWYDYGKKGLSQRSPVVPDKIINKHHRIVVSVVDDLMTWG